MGYKVNYTDGKEHGPREWYYENGQLRIKANHKDGKRDGLWEYYQENGGVRAKPCYKNNEKTDMSYCEK